MTRLCGEQAAAAAKGLGFEHPKDRNNKVTDNYSTEEMDSAQDRYRKACHMAVERVREQLQQLAARIQVRARVHVLVIVRAWASS